MRKIDPINQEKTGTCSNKNVEDLRKKSQHQSYELILRFNARKNPKVDFNKGEYEVPVNELDSFAKLTSRTPMTIGGSHHLLSPVTRIFWHQNRLKFSQ